MKQRRLLEEYISGDRDRRGADKTGVVAAYTADECPSGGSS